MGRCDPRWRFGPQLRVRRRKYLRHRRPRLSAFGARTLQRKAADLLAGDRLLASRSDRYFRGFDMKLADYWRVLEWRREYDEQEAAGTLPQLTLLRLAHDHFGDFDKAIDGVSSVETQMADNDYS